MVALALARLFLRLALRTKGPIRGKGTNNWRPLTENINGNAMAMQYIDSIDNPSKSRAKFDLDVPFEAKCRDIVGRRYLRACLCGKSVADFSSRAP